jgi:hypothetical protein
VDGSRFDALTLRLAVSRRGALRALVAAAGATLLGRLDAEAAACRAPGSTCREHANCCSRLCGPKDATGRRRCQCQTAADCPTPANTCLKPTCTAGICSNPVQPDNAPCDDGDPCTGNDHCQAGICVGTPLAGFLEDCVAHTDCCAGLVCGFEGHCVEPAGGPCDDKFDCVTLRCTNNVCQQAIGGGFCAFTSDCAAGTCIDGKCGEVPPGGACVDKFACTTIKCTDNVCQQSIGGEACATDGDCVAGTCVGGDCLSPAGGPCADKFGCTTLSCTGGVCDQSIGGGECATTADCAAGTCISGECGQVPAGGPCEDKFGCASISCTGGVCD